MTENNFCVIMAGGIGSRFWPISRNSKPKQFLDILGTGRTLLQQTFDRFAKICPVSNFYIVTSKDYLHLVLEQLPDLKPEQVLLEPFRRNTAPCISYSLFKIKMKNPDANIVVTPADHLILKEDEFINVINKGLKFTQNKEVLLTLGIKPNRPETGYGYIQINSEKEVFDNICEVKTFTEKPNLEIAKIFFESNEFFWNSGIFIWNLKSIIKAFENYLPDVYSLFNQIEAHYNAENEEEYINKTYFSCRNISIDYGIMEKAKNVYVLMADFGWSDLGTWGSLYEYSDKDNNANVIKGKNVFVFGTTNCIINLPNDKLAVIQGLDDVIIVESDNMLLLCKKQDEQKLRAIVNEIQLKKGEKFL